MHFCQVRHSEVIYYEAALILLRLCYHSDSPEDFHWTIEADYPQLDAWPGLFLFLGRRPV